MAKLWQKKNYQLDRTIEEFETSDDLVLDQLLTPYDVYGSLAHASMLQKIDILSSFEFQKIKKGLKEIIKLNKENKFNLKFGDEDIHTKIENYLIENFGDAGKKIHTGRSRNDQILLDLRLYAKAEMLQIWEEAINFVLLLNDLSQKYALIPMPGYTHMQKAMPSSLGMWFGAFSESLLDDLRLIQTAFSLNNQSPLGSGAGYGVGLPLDRKMVADLLGFEKVQNNSLYCQNSRGKFESVIVFSFLQIILDISKMASDILLFTTSEYDFFEIDSRLCTGSSIMPQKKNVDVAELLRSKVYVLENYFLQIFNIITNLPSGYNRDVQDTKKPFLESFRLTKKVLSVAQTLCLGIKPNKEKLKKAMTSELFNAHFAFELVSQGQPFREAYRTIGEKTEKLENFDVQKILLESNHCGATGNLGQRMVKKQIMENKKLLDKEISEFTKKIEELIKD